MRKSFMTSHYLGSTHSVDNQPVALENYNLFRADRALQEAVVREGAAWAQQDLVDFGRLAGLPATIALGFDANHYKPRVTHP